MKVSIITVVYNNVKTIDCAIQSVLAQDWENIEYIIVDGGSIDGTREKILEYGKKISRFVSEKDNGLYDAMNKGLAMATGDIVATVNSDDYLANSDVVRKNVELMEKEACDCTYSNLVYIEPDSGKVVRYWKSSVYKKEKFLWGWMPPHPTFFVRKNVYDLYGHFNLNFYTSADYELILRFLYKYGLKAAWLDQITVVMRTGGQSNASLKNRLIANMEDRKAWVENRIHPIFFTGFFKFLLKMPQFFQRPTKSELSSVYFRDRF